MNLLLLPDIPLYETKTIHLIKKKKKHHLTLLNCFFFFITYTNNFFFFMYDESNYDLCRASLLCVILYAHNLINSFVCHTNLIHSVLRSYRNYYYYVPIPMVMSSIRSTRRSKHLNV